MPTRIWVTPECPRQKGNMECGYYMMKFMKELLEETSQTIDAKVRKLTEKDTYSMAELDEVRVELVEFIVQYNVQVSSSIKGKQATGYEGGNYKQEILEEVNFNFGSDYTKGESSIRAEEVIGSFVIEKENFSVGHEGGNYKQETLDSSVVIEEENFSFVSDYNKGESSDSTVNVGKWGNKQYENIVAFRTPSSLPQHLGQQIQWPTNAFSGMSISDHSKRTYLELRKHKRYKYVIYKIDEKKGEVVVEKTGGRAEKHAQFVASLPTDDCRFAVYDLDFLRSDNSRKIKILLIHWCPSESNARAKVLYAVCFITWWIEGGTGRHPLCDSGHCPY